jgi:hypothetical protein
MTGLPVQPPDPAAPGPFRLSSPSQLQLLLREAGFSDIRVEGVAMTLELASAAEYLQVFGDVAWKARVASLSDNDLVRFKEETSRAVQPHLDRVTGALRLAAASLCASARR